MPPNSSSVDQYLMGVWESCDAVDEGIRKLTEALNRLRRSRFDTVHECAEDIAILASASQQTQAAVDHLVVRAHRNQNVSAHFHRLPFEVISDIFCYVLEDELHPAPLRLAMTQVSSAWNTIVQTTPKLWVTLRQGYNEHLITKSIDQSKACLLNIQGDEWEEDTNLSSAMPLKTFLGMVIPHSHRWATAAVSFKNHEDNDLLQDVEAPNLTLLNLSSTTPLSLKLGRILGEQDARQTNVTDLILDTVSVVGRSAPMAGLTRLALVDVEGLSLTDILSSIRSSPDLRLLTLSNLKLSSYDTPEVKERITLGCLDYLEVTDCDSTLSSSILSTISAPANRILYFGAVEAAPSSNLSDLLSSHIFPFISPVSEVLDKGEHLELRFMFRDRVGLIVSDADRTFRLDIPFSSCTEIWTWVESNRNASAPLHVDFSGDYHIAEGPEFFAFLSRLPVSSVTMNCWELYPEALFGFMTKLELGAVEWSWPALHCIKLDATTLIEGALLRLLTARCGRNGFGEDEGMGQLFRPAPISTFELRIAEPLSPITEAKIRKILGGECDISLTEY